MEAPRLNGGKKCRNWKGERRSGTPGLCLQIYLEGSRATGLPGLAWPSQTHSNHRDLGGASSGLRLPICKTGGLDSLLSKRPSSPEVEWGGLPRVSERRPLQLRFNKPSVRLELIKTRLELSRVSDLHGLKSPRIHPSLFPVNNWAPVGFPGRAGRLTSLLHSELDQERPGGKETHSRASICAPTTPPHGGWGLAQGPHPSHGQDGQAASWSPQARFPGNLAPPFPSHTLSTDLLRTPENRDGNSRPLLRSPPQRLRGPDGSPPLPLLLHPFLKETKKCTNQVWNSDMLDVVQ